MKYIVAMIACTLVGCAAHGPKPSDLICTNEQCSASLEQHPGQTDWFIVIDSDCGTVKTADGKELAICGGERWVGDGDVEIVSGSCRVCARQVPGKSYGESTDPEEPHSMKKKHRSYRGVELRYEKIRGEKKFRLPPGERSVAIDDRPNKHRDQFDNNPGHTPPAQNPDEL